MVTIAVLIDYNITVVVAVKKAVENMNIIALNLQMPRNKDSEKCELHCSSVGSLTPKPNE